MADINKTLKAGERLTIKGPKDADGSYTSIPAVTLKAGDRAVVSTAGTAPTPTPTPTPTPHVAIKEQFDRENAHLRGLSAACAPDHPDAVAGFTALITTIKSLRTLCEGDSQADQAPVAPSGSVDAAFTIEAAHLTELKIHCVDHHHETPDLASLFDDALDDLEALRVMCLDHGHPEPTPTPTPTPTPSAAWINLTAKTVEVEAQSWWNGPIGGGHPDLVPFPFRHVHARVVIPMGRAVSGTHRVAFRFEKHGNTGVLELLKWQDDVGDGPRTVIKKPERVITEDVYHDFLDIPTGNEKPGWRLWRFYAVFRHPNGNRHVARPRFAVFIGKDGSVSGAIPYAEGPTGWYDERGSGGPDWGYAGFDVDRTAWNPFTPKTGVWSVPVRPFFSNKAGIAGLNPKEWYAHIDPSFHAGKAGIELGRVAGLTAKTLSINTGTLTKGEHRLVLRLVQEFNGRHHEGVGVYPFIVG